MLAAVCWIWRPSPTSKFLAQVRLRLFVCLFMCSSRVFVFVKVCIRIAPTKTPHTPKTTSKQAKQLPTSEAGAHGEEGIEFSISSQFSIADDEDLDDDDYDHPQGGVARGRGAVAALR